MKPLGVAFKVWIVALLFSVAVWSAVIWGAAWLLARVYP